MIKEIVGPIPRDDNFYDRKDLIRDMWNIADEHDIFLIGPRRFGKSGILCRMHDIPEKGFKVIFMDCEKLEDPYEFFAELLVEVLKNKTLRLKIKDCANSIPLIPTKIIDKIKDHISEIELSEVKVVLRESIEKHWKEESIRCIKELNKLACENNEKILGSTCRYYFDYYEDRLKEYGSINENGAKAIITELSKAGKLTKSELFDIFMLAIKSEDSTKFDDLMNDLEMDFYIKFDPGNNNYSFLSKVLSDWWLRWHLPSRIRR